MVHLCTSLCTTANTKTSLTDLLFERKPQSTLPIVFSCLCSHALHKQLSHLCAHPVQQHICHSVYSTASFCLHDTSLPVPTPVQQIKPVHNAVQCCTVHFCSHVCSSHAVYSIIFAHLAILCLTGTTASCSSPRSTCLPSCQARTAHWIREGTFTNCFQPSGCSSSCSPCIC